MLFWYLEMSQDFAQTMASKLNEIFDKYKAFVITNHTLVGKIESAIRCSSYFIPGQSFVLAEMLYSTSNLLAFVNDAILRKAADIRLSFPIPHKELCYWLNVLESVEVFVELAAYGFGDDMCKWIVVFCIHVVKAVIKFVLLLKYNSGILQTPSIPSLKRDVHLQKQLELSQNAPRQQIHSSFGEDSLHKDGIVDNIHTKLTFTLPSSGRKVRCLKTAPPISQRSWQVPTVADDSVCQTTKLTQLQTLGECLHISRPLCHLISVFLFGKNSWKPWFVAGGLDISSLYLLGDTSQYNKVESKELRRRHLLMILYLLRSPFYDKYTKERLLMTLAVLAKYLPGVRLIIRPLMEYLPWWQKIYFYVWMT